MFGSGKTTRKEGGIEKIRFLYAAIFAAILSIFLANLEVNFVWLRDFTADFRESIVKYELSQASHVAGMMKEELMREVSNTEELAESLKLFTGQEADSERRRALVGVFLRKNHDLRELAIFNLDGREEERYSRNEISSSEDFINLAGDEQFELTKEEGSQISSVKYNEKLEPFVVISSPVFSFGGGGLEKIITTKYFLRGMWEIALEMKIGETGRISVFDEKGILIADPEPSRVLKKTELSSIGSVKAIINDQAGQKMESWESYEHLFMNDEQMRRFSLNGESYHNEKGSEVIGVAVPLDLKGKRWGVLVEQNLVEAEAPISEVNRWLIIFLVANLFTVAILLWVILILRQANRKLFHSQYILEVAKEKAEDEVNKTVSIIANFVDPVIVVNSSWEVALINPAAQRIFGLSAKDLGKRINFSQAGFSFEAFKNMIPVTFETTVLEKDENDFVALEEVVVGRRDPEQKLSESALTGSVRHELTYKVISRPVADKDKVCYGHMKIFYNLTRERMVDRMKSDFVSIVAHQLRTPLSAIKWAIGIVISGDAGKISVEQENFLRKGYDSNERMIGLVNDLLNVSRIEEGRFGFSFEKVDFQEILNNVVANLEGVIARKHLKVTLDKKIKLPTISLDRSKIELALQNIVDNAVKYTPEFGEINIGFDLTQEFLKVKVRDSGVGIPKIDQERLFSKFFRSSNVVKMQTEGSGLGLYIVRNIIEKHGGKINIESEEDEGTEVSFELPLKMKENNF